MSYLCETCLITALLSLSILLAMAFASLVRGFVGPECFLPPPSKEVAALPGCLHLRRLDLEAFHSSGGWPEVGKSGYVCFTKVGDHLRMQEIWSGTPTRVALELAKADNCGRAEEGGAPHWRRSRDRLRTFGRQAHRLVSEALPTLWWVGMW